MSVYVFVCTYEDELKRDPVYVCQTFRCCSLSFSSSISLLALYCSSSSRRFSWETDKEGSLWNSNQSPYKQADVNEKKTKERAVNKTSLRKSKTPGQPSVTVKLPPYTQVIMPMQLFPWQPGVFVGPGTLLTCHTAHSINYSRAMNSFKTLVPFVLFLFRNKSEN